ncbi:expressed unknown protein [Seminavis robusta]|uniref:Uncharacterized protein n=1 Tax=Seminavis robusta TaxID=568900 RepID=A0A9N8EVD4_9STRA|nr:expressed unknown protein [Seminavis robusta]|eukprot:Sro1723_g293640.1 n/a (855) ;mRNA; f:11952-14516
MNGIRRSFCIAGFLSRLWLICPILAVDVRLIERHHWNDTSLVQLVENLRQVIVVQPQDPTRKSSKDDDKNNNMTLTFPLPCAYEQSLGHDDYHHYYKYWIQESTSSLLAAKALAKTARKTRPRLDDFAWDMMDALLLQPEQLNKKEDGGTTSSSWFFQSQGLLPKYWYIATKEQQEQHEVLPMRIELEAVTNNTASGERFTHPPYVHGTRFPHWSLFAGNTKDLNVTLDLDGSSLMQSSHRLSAIPLHASMLWGMVLAVIPPEQDKDNNNPQDFLRQQNSQPSQHHRPYSYVYKENPKWWDRVYAYYQRIFRHHAYLHQVVMRGCSQKQKQQQTSSVPCYNILHPWESLIDPTSPTWATALAPIMRRIQQESWTPPFSIPRQVRESYDFPKQNPLVYDAMIYLLVEGWNTVNISKACPANETTNHGTPSACGEDAIWNATSSFAMLDVGYAAVLAQADDDLYRLAQILERVLPDASLSQQMSILETWQLDNARLLQQVLWNPQYQTYMSKYYNSQQQKMEWLDTVAVSNNLLPFWNVAATGDIVDADDNSADDDDLSGNKKRKQKRQPNSGKMEHDDNDDDPANSKKLSALAREHWQDLSLQLLRRDGRFAFDCGSFPIWSMGCQDSVGHNESHPIIQPIVNYLVSSGLFQSDKMEIFSNYLSGQSLSLFVRPNMDIDSTSRRGPTYFGEAFGVETPYPNLAACDICGNTSTITAAIVYNFRSPDPTHANRLPLPPIRRSWVITLVTIELFVAFSIGVSCLVVSFSLVRKLQRLVDEEELVGWEDETMSNGAVVGGSYYASTATNEDAPEVSPAVAATTSGTSPLLDTKDNATTGSATETAMGAQSFFSSIGLN